MFAQACSIARKFTFPIIISHRTVDGKCHAGIGSLVLINEDGWFVTAFHIIDQIRKLMDESKKYRKIIDDRKKIEDDPTLLHETKKKKLKDLKIEDTFITNYSIFPGMHGTKIGSTIHGIPLADLAVGQLVNFDKSKILEFPKFKDPTKPMEQGTSLCKGGFPFHSITPTFDESTGFNLPPGSLPIPFFPIDGIYTRMVDLKTDDPNQRPIKLIETSTPGLRGQSGGPTFDIHGTIWAIQSRTQHLKLGFGGSQKDKKEHEHLQHQYLNVGWGIHSETIVNFLTEKKVNFHLSAY